MKFFLLATCALLASCASVLAQEKHQDTEIYAPIPSVVSTRSPQNIPSDAVMLFDGHDLSAWLGEKQSTPEWTVADGVLTVKAESGGIFTKRAFDDCQLHLEWRSPVPVTGEGQSRGNSGIYFQQRYEIQILDSYENPTYVNGQAGSLYKQHAPLVNASRRPGEWQVYDIVFRAPRFNADGTLRRPANATVFHNGVLIQDHAEFAGPTAWIGHPAYKAHPFKQPLALQAHGSPVSFRNIWVRELTTPETESLLNGKDLTGWYSFLEHYGRAKDPEGNFKMENGLVHVRGKDFGYISTEKSYADFHLRAEFKWGQAQWAPRQTGKRDSGILFHFAPTEPDKVWPKSIECQVQEGDCGDIWFVATDGTSPNPSEFKWNQKHVFKNGDYENPTGEWNTIEVVCIGNRLEHYVNGHLVNVASDLSVDHGRILLQSEGAEVYYRNLSLTPLGH